MKKLVFLVIVVMFTMGLAQAQFQDILGPHNVNGHGCASCHAPHNGGAGNAGASSASGTTTIASEGTDYLWGRDFVSKDYGTFKVDSAALSTDPTIFHTAACLSCHDGAVTPVGMTGQSFEKVEIGGAQASGSSVNTYIGTDAQGLANDHPVHVAYNPSGYNWPGTLAAGVITWGTPTAPAVGWGTNPRTVRFYANATANLAMVECSTCHNPHAMNKVKIGSTVQTTKFFIRGWYNADSSASNSAAQFCRSCHFSKSNEYLGVTSTTL